MYLEHFRLNELPFTLTPNTNFYCELAGHQEALNVLLVSLRSGEGFIKIVGEVGTGKTLLCRKLLNSLGSEFVTAYIPNPDLTPSGLRRALAKELGVEAPANIDQHGLLECLSDRLLELHEQGRKVVVVLDEAQALPTDSLEALRLLTNLETETTKLWQIVLLGQPELDTLLELPSLRQLKQRIGFSYRLPPMNRSDLDAYLCHRLAMAGYTHGALFSARAKRLLYQCSNGIPRVVNILCHKAMLVSYGKGKAQVDRNAMQSAIKDTEVAVQSQGVNWWWWTWSAMLLLGLAVGYRLSHGV